MTPLLSHEIQRGDQKTRVALIGEITEEADFSALTNLGSPRLVVDLSRITRINSSGLREWIEFVRACNQAGATLTLENCAPLVVNQLNMIWRFAGEGGSVSSVFAPYYCKHCDLEHQVLIDLSRGPVDAPASSIPCPKCGQTAEFDDIREVYLQFQTSL